MNELNGDQGGRLFTSHLIRDILRQVQVTNRYVRHYTNNIHFQNGPKNLNKNKKDIAEREDIHKKKVLKQISQFSNRASLMEMIFGQMRTSFSGWQIFELEGVFEARRYIRWISVLYLLHV